MWRGWLFQRCGLSAVNDWLTRLLQVRGASRVATVDDKWHNLVTYTNSCVCQLACLKFVIFELWRCVSDELECMHGTEMTRWSGVFSNRWDEGIKVYGTGQQEAEEEETVHTRQCLSIVRAPAVALPRVPFEHYWTAVPLLCLPQVCHCAGLSMSADVARLSAYRPISSRPTVAFGIKAVNHFAVTRLVEAWVDLGTVVRCAAQGCILLVTVNTQLYLEDYTLYRLTLPLDRCHFWLVAWLSFKIAI